MELFLSLSKQLQNTTSLVTKETSEVVLDVAAGVNVPQETEAQNQI